MDVREGKSLRDLAVTAEIMQQPRDCSRGTAQSLSDLKKSLGCLAIAEQRLRDFEKNEGGLQGV